MSSRTSVQRFWPALALLTGLIACGDPAITPAGGSPDGGDSQHDAGDDADLGYDNPDEIFPEVGPDEIPPVDEPFVLTLDGQEYDFSDAYFGLTHPQMSEQGRWEFYIEVSEGGAEGCPSEDSATPARTMLVLGVVLDIDGNLSTDNPELVIFDYMGDFIDPAANPPLIRTEDGAQITPIVTDYCLDDCVGQPAPSQPESRLKLFVAGTFPQGQGQGMIEATHCDSMDLLPPAAE
ncbi:hypothetical protein DL240_14740 [Lujinxingia litoralis]|uniref:Lipoprotein n=1 Tax=Lujinxingia litoralis TaxID=2211119 RepID=A0A328C795_9DELT|nr:hypothetical protein [Lujinxingia litoralis]RAL20929.1 hypothetical protein DL240_14740 [Lujinxingia litoralis]